MAERLMDGTIKLRSGRVMYGNSIPALEDWPELLEVFNCPPKVPPFRTAPEFLPLIESMFRAPDGQVYTFRLGTGSDYASVSLDTNNPLSIGREAASDRAEVDRARKMLGIKDPESPAGLWLEACIQAMLGTWPKRKGR